MGSRAAPGQQSRLGQDETTGADTHRTPCLASRSPHEVEDSGQWFLRQWVVDPDDDPGIRQTGHIEWTCFDGEPQRRTHQATGRREALDAIEGFLRDDIRVLEHRLRRQ
ncbi:hypothetical protein D9M70_513350 [compost metagenome]